DDIDDFIHLLENFHASLTNGGMCPNMVRFGEVAFQIQNRHFKYTADAVAKLEVSDFQHIDFCLIGKVKIPSFGQFIDRMLFNMAERRLAGPLQGFLDDLVQPEVAAFGNTAL